MIPQLIGEMIYTQVDIGCVSKDSSLQAVAVEYDPKRQGSCEQSLESKLCRFRHAKLSNYSHPRR